MAATPQQAVKDAIKTAGSERDLKLLLSFCHIY